MILEKYKMNGIGDSTIEYDAISKDGSFEDVCPREDLEIKPLMSHQQRYKKNLLTNAKKSFIILEQQSLIDCLQADEEYIVSAGRDHDINVWTENAGEGQHTRRLSGHRGPVTGLSLFNSSHSNFDKIIVSSSEDGSIRVWSLNEGQELHKIETGKVITCMGIINKSLAITGNHKGYLEVYHLRSGDLYTSIRAHSDPVDALEVDGDYACTATFEEPSCLKVWNIQFEQTKCIYRLEKFSEIQFCCLAIWKTKVVLGASNQQKLFVIDFENDILDPIDLNRSCGKIERIKVWNEWIISCSTYKSEVLLDIHRFHNYEHFGTFSIKMQQIKTIAAIELEHNFKIAIGGSALALLSFDFVLTEEDTPYNRFPFTSEKTIFTQSNKTNHYTMKTAGLGDFHAVISTDSDDSESEHEELSNFEGKREYSLTSGVGDAYFKLENDDSSIPLLKYMEEESSNKYIQSPQHSDFYEYKTNLTNSNTAFTPKSCSDGSNHVNNKHENNKIELSAPPTEMLSVLTFAKTEACTSSVMRNISPTQEITEARVAMRKLKEELDANKQLEESENAKTNETMEKQSYDIVIVKDIELGERKDANIELIELECDDNHTKETENEIKENMKFNDDREKAENLISNHDLAEKATNIKLELLEENLCDTNKSSKKKSKKCKKNKKKESQKSKHKKCQIM